MKTEFAMQKNLQLPKFQIILAASSLLQSQSMQRLFFAATALALATVPASVRMRIFSYDYSALRCCARGGAHAPSKAFVRIDPRARLRRVQLFEGLHE